jgi:hypothetical protein
VASAPCSRLPRVGNSAYEDSAEKPGYVLSLGDQQGSQVPRRRRTPLLLGYWYILPVTCLILAGLLAAVSFSFAVGAVAAGVVCTPLAGLNILRVVFLVRIGRKGWDAKVERKLA